MPSWNVLTLFRTGHPVDWNALASAATNPTVALSESVKIVADLSECGEFFSFSVKWFQEQHLRNGRLDPEFRHLVNKQLRTFSVPVIVRTGSALVFVFAETQLAHEGVFEAMQNVSGASLHRLKLSNDHMKRLLRLPNARDIFEVEFRSSPDTTGLRTVTLNGYALGDTDAFHELLSRDAAITRATVDFDFGNKGRFLATFHQSGVVILSRGVTEAWVQNLALVISEVVDVA